MSHYSLGVLVPPEELDFIEEYIETQLAPFNENLEVEPYVCYTLKQAEQDLIDEINELEQALARRDEAYRLDRCQVRLAKLRQMTPQQRYQEFADDSRLKDDRGRPLSTYNPNSKWDWYSIGGRWDGWLHDRKPHSESIADNLAPVSLVLEREKFPFALVTPDRTWHSQGNMRWFGVVLNDKGTPPWHTEAAEILRRHLDCSLVLLDAHI